MKIDFWNVRGFNRPLKHNGVAHLIKNNQLCLLDILETKLAATTVPRIIHRSFPGWCQVNYFNTIVGGRILIIWNPAIIDLNPEDISPQKEHVGETFRTGMAVEYAVAHTRQLQLCEISNGKTTWDSSNLAVFLTEAERHFYYQKAKIHFLKQDDRNAKVFHDMVKNMAKNSIFAVTKSDGTIITSAPDIAQEFIGFYTSLLVTLNGSLHGFFPGMKGLRQGDPMSPALFLLCMEFFSRLIKRNTSNSDFNFHLKCEKLKITYFLFADDLMLFSRGDLSSIYILMECLQVFRDVSGLAINISKSSIFIADIQNDELDEIIARMEFVGGDMPVRYLGILPAAKRLRRQLLRRFTDCAGPSSGILREHRWPGRKFAIRRKNKDWEILATWDRLAFLQEDSSCSLCINMGWHHPMYVNPSQCGQVTQEREDWLLYVEQSATSHFGMHGLQPLEAPKRNYL
ncbi:UNVERIFIED_CONTAM: hypothetical protein Scaly_2414800 [Sesamum calycinum]|uniref:Reverse transcriptase domain-containing protein n=1 Tax=Sesamum calycinum TaxID=2727403 RepID=A0AAW2M260_9LAMI